ncbi:AraC family transcriptional regulator [Vibrio owensii]|uniref:AraC family transcriptional regulator n=2 Tax=Vibrionaceae TaxID=641 RepID=A0AAP9KC56_9VIBR|nr:AraC family transcriptional regulator [Vibrio owensii]AYO17232.1 AraC family transcriptional regulator [Vibrio owensii]AYO23072.1 AraC family transcriptional regulator [Vibrio owensii]QGH49374.1 helix-turn-helix domain-containing protein [Vibrio owensii]QLK48623.1 AraC family transcriptional regulator [Vibrio owensii]CAH1533683.1 AraC-type DNA-binding domain-containing protein [Vibrio owensii]
MCEKPQNLCESVIEQFAIKTEWHDDVHLAPACKERFLTLTEIPEWKRADIFMAGLAELRDGYHVERDKVGVHTLLFTIEGGGVLITPDFVKEIEPYTLTILPVDTCFRFEMNPSKGLWKMVWLLPQNTEAWQHLSDLGQTVVPFRGSEQVWSLMTLLYNEIGGRTGFRQLLISEVQRLVKSVETPISTSLSRVQTLFNEVEGQLHLPWTIAEMAKQCFISEEQFNRLSKQLFNMSPRSKLIELRMHKAADLLQYPAWSVAMIANRLGYRDPYNFTHRFKKFYGTSPTRYRKRLLENQNQ